MTYKTYLRRFKEMTDELVGILMDDRRDPEMQSYAYELQMYGIAPHACRHAFKAVSALVSRTAQGKDDGALCFAVAAGRPCIHPGPGSCLACPYKADTRATLYGAACELKRLQALQKAARTDAEKMKYGLLIRDVVAPSIAQAVSEVKKLAGDAAAEKVLEAIKEALAGAAMKRMEAQANESRKQNRCHGTCESQV